MELLHTMIRVKNIEESLKFYQDFMELKLVKQKQLDDCQLYFLTDERGVMQIELTYNNEIPPQGYDLGTGFGHIAVRVKSMNEITSRVKQFGYRYLYEPYKLSPTGSTIAFIQDPDGYEIELIEKNNI